MVSIENSTNPVTTNYSSSIGQASKLHLKKIYFQYNYIWIRFGTKHVWEHKAPTTNKNITFVIVTYIYIYIFFFLRIFIVTYLIQLTKWIMCNVHDRTHVILLLVVGAKSFPLYLEGLEKNKPILSKKGSFGPAPNSIPKSQKMGLAWSWGWQSIKN